mgnify:CR=1 FL=1
MALVPWHKAINPRPDLRDGKPLDAAEFAVHLDQVRDNRAPVDYQNPKQFFERTYLTENLADLAAQVVRRLSGERTETSAVFNMSTQFGGGKTHALTLLYHLAKSGAKANAWAGVSKILQKAGIDAVPEAATAVFVGTEFDSLTGRGGEGEPVRKTPWGEIAYQIGGDAGFAAVAEHETQLTAPGGDVIRRILPQDRPCLILMDELLNYISRTRRSGLSDQLYDFLQNLSSVVSGQDNVVLVVSLPSLVNEMTPEDHSDYTRFKKLLDRVGKAIIISAESDTSEIIRRRLFEWDSNAITLDGKVPLSKEAVKTCKSYADWVKAHKQQIPGWFPVDHAQETFEASYPFHPLVLSVFERKWQALPRFQRTRGVLRLLALWASRAYRENYTGAHQDALIGLGSAPLDDPIFRAAVFEQLNEDLLDGAVTTDITGKKESHAIRLDEEAGSAIKKARLHRKVATAIFFESNGGQTHGTYATQPEIRLAVAEPDMDIGNVEAVLDTLSNSCYFLSAEGTNYRFSLQPNLNKIISDRKAGVPGTEIAEWTRSAIITAFNASSALPMKFFPEKSGDIPDHTALTLAVLSPNHLRKDRETELLLESLIKEHGTSARTYKNALLFAVDDSEDAISAEARNAIAWTRIRDEEDQLHLDERQKKDVSGKIAKAEKDLREAVWRSYKHIAMLGRDNQIQWMDLGLIHSSSAKTIVDLYLSELLGKDIVSKSINPRLLVNNWPAFQEWSTRSVLDAVFASPRFPKLFTSDAIKDAICKGVSNGFFAYVSMSKEGEYDPIFSKTELQPQDIEISDDWFIVKEPLPPRDQEPDSIIISPGQISIKPGDTFAFRVELFDKQGKKLISDNVEWHATGGTIDQLGNFKAGQGEGSFAVTASVGTINGSASVIIVVGGTLQRVEVAPQDSAIGPGKVLSFSAQGYYEDGHVVPIRDILWSASGGSIDDKGIFTAGQEEGIFEIEARSGDIVDRSRVTIKKLKPHWEGEIPHQRWTQFYNRVLSKFATRKGLKLTVSVDIPDASEDEIEEMKLALRELSLQEDIEV